MKLKSTFPERVEFKSCAATIYHQQRRKGECFEVRYYNVDGSLQRLTFPTYPGAKKFAELAVKELAENRQHFVTLRGRDAFEYQTALETLAPLGLTISQAAKPLWRLQSKRQLPAFGRRARQRGRLQSSIGR